MGIEPGSTPGRMLPGLVASLSLMSYPREKYENTSIAFSTTG